MAVATGIQVAGFVPVSMIDWEGKLAAIIFLSGCNLRCPYCHNPELVEGAQPTGLSWGPIAEKLEEKKTWLDGIVITGGEPTIDKNLTSLICELREGGFLIKLDTNGTRPETIHSLIENSLVDYFAVDIKARFENYEAATKAASAADKVKESIDIVAGSQIDHEFRTTAVPDLLDLSDLVELAKYLAGAGARRYIIQQFNPEKVLDKGYQNKKPLQKEELERAVQRCREYLPTKLRGVS